MDRQDEFRTAQLQELRNRIDKGLAEAQQGEAVDGESFMQGLIDDIDSRDATRKAG
jgi:predicted transcriptional regulator